MVTLIIFLGKTLSLISRIAGWGNGSTWPGHIALSIDPNFIKKVLKNSKIKIILIAGTNGKTTTAKIIQTIFEANGLKVFRNVSGANLLNGIASSLLLHSNILCEINYDYAIFEVDENSLPLVLKELTPNYLLLLNLFRDQLDRYGEVNTIASKWHSAVQNLTSSTKLILNADDPQIAWLSLCHPELDSGSRVFYFGLNDPQLGLSKQEHAIDSSYCPKCGSKLSYKTIYYSHLGDWECKKCKLKRPKLDSSTPPLYPLDGIYNRYNTTVAVLLAKLNNISTETIKQSLKGFKPAFGRQEKLTIDGKQVQLFLSKNPTSFNQSLRTISELKAKNLLIVLNDRIPDGRDVSWIWDVDFEDHVNERMRVYISGDRCFDLALRIKYSFHPPAGGSKFKIEPELKRAVAIAIKDTPENETLYILPTYSAMLDIRKILTGKKIL